MPSTFFGLTIAGSGLNAAQAGLNTTANNISNVQTKGYTRQQANRVAGDALRTYTRYGSMGSGVVTTSITQIRNQYYDTKYWYNQSSVGLYETKLSYLQQIENNFIDEETTEGFSSILNKMFNALDTLKNNAGDINVRQQFVGKAQNLATYFNSVASGLADTQGSTNDEIKSTVANINAIAERISILNYQINVIELQGGHANELRDQRALLIDELSAIVPTEVSEAPIKDSNNQGRDTGANYFTVKIGGQILVDSYDYNKLTCEARKNKVNQSDIEGLYDIKWETTGNTFHAGADSMTGSLKALFDIRDGNNGENLTGVASVKNNQELIIESPSITAIEAMTMPEEGVLTINGRDYYYKGFTFETNADGKITSYTFNLDPALTNEQVKQVDGMKASIGSPIRQMGVPYYMAQMNQFLRSFGKAFNDILKSGEDLDGNKTDYYAFFTAKNPVTGQEYTFNGVADSSDADSYYKLTAGNFIVSDICVKNPGALATTEDITKGSDAYDLVDKLAALKSDTVLYRGGNAEDFLKAIISDISVDTQKAKLFYENHTNVAHTVDSQRLSVSGVDEDEEALNLIKFQNSYNLASKMISVMSEIYDRLILQTGV